MADAAEQLKLLLDEVAKKLTDEPQTDSKQLVAHLKTVLPENLQLANAASRMIQVNQDDTRGFQTLVEGGIALVGTHYHVDKDTLKTVIDTFIQEQKSKPVGIPQNITPSSTDKFVGRGKELELLHQQLQRNDEVVIAAVEGMGGVGKTELAIQYSLLHF
ncbi:MAG: hypothetical protein JO235_13755 [Chroococcidiopsidaceae cyanobacterium CP_BM_RX_35]|nr:hypothetical protein [Chroococcidiopsidaceae cyanobacterium CP_BM_RX_35]